MANKRYKIKYLPTSILQLNNILYYITYTLNNKIAANNLYKEIVKQIEKRSEAPDSYKIFKTVCNVKFYRINVKKYSIFYTVKNNTMEIRRIYYGQRNIDKIL